MKKLLLTKSMPEKKKLKFKLGCDPEFSFVYQGKRVSANHLLDSSLKRKKGFTLKDCGFECEGGIMGWDGCASTAEMRPKAADSIKELVGNIKSIITNSHQHLTAFDMSVLSVHAPVGGHIHFQISAEMHINQRLVESLHRKIASFFLPILISENKMNLRIRSQGGGYGNLTDFHGDNRFSRPDGNYDYTYEFRTPSAEWLTTEKICEATFAYLAVIYNEIMYQPENFKKFMYIVYRNKEQAQALHKLAVTEYIGITETLFNDIKKAVKTFELYQDYKEQVDYILSPKKVMEDKKKAEYNIVLGWNLRKALKIKDPSFKMLMNDKKFKELASKKNLDIIQNSIDIQFNDDVNVGGMVKSFTEHAAAFEWKLKNNYFIFGMKKGINTPIIFNQDKEVISGMEEVKTICDKTAMKSMVDRIVNKFFDDGFSSRSSKTINPITMEMEKKKIVMIGLPYDMRIANDAKSLIKIIYPLEKKTPTAINLEMDSKNLVDDRDRESNEKGDFYKYVNDIGIEKNEAESIPFDNCSQGARLANQHIQEIINEEEQGDPIAIAQENARRMWVFPPMPYSSTFH
jgi:Phage phiEco32-like COOH.NH2 ligase-type 2